MHFTAATGASFQSMQDPSQGDTIVEVAQQTKPGQPLGFTLTGTGVINESPAQTASGAAQQDQQQAQPQGRDNRPGGGLGAPIDAPDALQQYRWPILGGFAVLLAIGGWVVTKRQTTSAVPATSAVKLAAPSPDKGTTPPPPPAAPAPASAPAAKSSMLLEALKEEIFQLEIERKQGKITPEDYDKAKAALDQTLERALKRQG